MKVREPVVAGTFYPDNADELKHQIKSCLSEASKKYNNIFGLVAPHAGYVYSGKTAGAVYSLIKDEHYKTVIVISPSHQEYFPGVSIYDGGEYKTPLGKIEVNHVIAEKLTNNSTIIYRGEEGHRQEHALEVHLPFLQTVLKDFSIVPIVIGDQRSLFVNELAEKIKEVYESSMLIVASSDMSHFHSKEQADYYDSKIEKCILDYDSEGLLEILSKNKAEACGGGCIAVLLKAGSLLNKEHTEIIARSDSGDVSGDNDKVVGYLSAIVY